MDPLVSSYLLSPPPFSLLIFSRFLFFLAYFPSSALNSALVFPLSLCVLISNPLVVPVFPLFSTHMFYLLWISLPSSLTSLPSFLFGFALFCFLFLWCVLVSSPLLFSFGQLLSPLFSCHLILPLVLSFPLLISPPPFIISWILSFFLLFSSRLLFPLILLIHPLSSSYTYISFFSPLFIHFSLFLFPISSLMSLPFCSSLLLFLLLIFHITTSSLSISSLILTTIEWTSLFVSTSSLFLFSSSPTLSFYFLSTLPFTYIIFIFGPFFFIYILPFVVFLIITPPDIFKFFLYFSIFLLFSPQHVVFSVF